MRTRGPVSAVFPGARASPQALFICGALLFPPFLMQQDLVVRTGLILLFMILNVLAGKRVRLLQFALVSTGIILFNLVIPTGRVLGAPLGLPITEGALKSGLMKATAMTGLLMLSQFSIRPKLRLPGRFGGLIGRSLFYFEAILNERRRIDRKDIIGSIDALLLSVRAAGEPAASTRTDLPPAASTRTDLPPAASTRTDLPPAAEGGFPRTLRNTRGFAVLLSLVAFNWVVFVLTLLHPHPFWGG